MAKDGLLLEDAGLPCKAGVSKREAALLFSCRWIGHFYNFSAMICTYNSDVPPPCEKHGAGRENNDTRLS